MNYEENNAAIILKSFVAAAETMAPEERLEFYEAIFHYSWTGEINEMSRTSAAVFMAIKPVLDKRIARYLRTKENGKKGGRPKNKTDDEPKQAQELPFPFQE